MESEDKPLIGGPIDWLVDSKFNAFIEKRWSKEQWLKKIDDIMSLEHPIVTLFKPLVVGNEDSTAQFLADFVHKVTKIS